MGRTIQLNDGKQIPALGWGNGTGGQAGAGQKAVDLGKYALQQGILHIDTAQSYRTETETGKAIEAAGISRDKVWVTTKISGATNVKSDPADIRRSVQESLDKLGSIPDLLLIHTPFVPDNGKIGLFWTALEDLVMDGTLKGCSLGVSNFRVQDLEEVFKVARIMPVVNQMEYHPYLLEHLEPVLALQAKHKIVTQSYGPLTPLLRHPTGGPIKPVLTRIAQRLSKESGKEVDEAQALLLWTVQKGVVAITTSGKEANIRKMVGCEALSGLTDEEVTEVEKEGRKVHFRHYSEHMTKDFPSPDLPKDI